MLYDVLPPLIFFSSLGGIVVVVSRVVVRSRREQFVLELKNQAAAVSDTDLHQPNRLARLIGPAGKGLKVFSNPLSLVRSIMQTTASRTQQSVEERKQQLAAWRKSVKAKQSKEPVTVEPIEVSSNLESIQPPTSRFRDFAGKLKRNLAGKTTAALGSVTSARKLIVEQKSAAVMKFRRDNASSNRKPLKPSKSKISLVKAEANLASPPVISDTASQQKAAKEQNKRISRLFAKEKAAPASTLEQARDALESDQLELVEEILIPYVIRNPRDARAYMMLGQVALSRGEWEDAVQAFQQVTSLNPKITGSYAALGHAAFKAGHMTKAIEHLQQAHNNDPGNRQVIEELLVIARNMDNVPLQQSLIAELAQLEPR